MKRHDVRYVSDFDWSDEDRLVVQPVHAVAVYQASGGVVLRQRRVAEQFDDQMVFIPQDSLSALVSRLDHLNQCDGIIDGTFRDADRVVPFHLAD